LSVTHWKRFFVYLMCYGSIGFLGDLAMAEKMGEIGKSPFALLTVKLLCEIVAYTYLT